MRLALHALEAGFDHRPLRAVDHDRDARNLRLGGDVVEELGHRTLGVEHALVHVDVEDVGAAAHLVERDIGRAGPVAADDQPREPLRAGDVGALADHLEIAVGPQDERLEPRVARQAVERRVLAPDWPRARWDAGDGRWRPRECDRASCRSSRR